MFIKYSTSLIPPKKSRGKGSRGKKTADAPQAAVEDSDESDSEPARKQTTSRRVIKKKVSISADDNIIPEPDVTLELGKSMSLTEAVEEEGNKNLLRTMQELKASRKSNKSQSLVEGSSEGIGVSPGVPDESTVIHATLSEGSKQESDYSKEDQGDDDKKIEDVNAESCDTGNNDEEITDATNADAEKAEEIKDDIKKVELLRSGSSLYVSSSFGNQFLNLSSDTSQIGTVKDTTDAEINSLLDIQIQ
ncbi:hypothetical protein Tco_0656236 [Tanacetum coccineum]|uniref:Uncharacterized protein n=1 Tax=Tanacetum coccineum TaxID=301880 RepID=A0ABQ4X9H0_9ASTR